MYKLIILFFTASAVAVTDSPGNPKSPPHEGAPMQGGYSFIQNSSLMSDIIRKSNEFNSDGSYRWSYETGNGISVEEEGRPLAVSGTPIGVTGSFTYKSPNFSPISLTYSADENGFRPVGDHLPVAPPIPPLIARALAWIAENPEPNKKR